MKIVLWARFLVILATAVSLVLLAACGSSGSTPATSTQPSAKSSAAPASGASPSAAAKQPFKVGVVVSVTGFNAALGSYARDAIMLYRDQINAAGGINGHPLEVDLIDDESDETKAITAAKKLIEDPKVLVLIGTSGSGQSMAMINAAIVPNNMPHVSLSSTGKQLDASPKLTFKVAPDEVAGAAWYFDYSKKKGWTKLALFTDNQTFGQANREFLKGMAPKSGIQIVDEETYAPKDTNMTTQLTKIKASGAQAIVLVGTGQEPAIVMKTRQDLGLDIPVMAPFSATTPEFLKLAGDAANGMLSSSLKPAVANQLPDSDPQKKVILDFAKAFKDKYNHDLENFAAHGHDGLQVAVEAIKRAGENPTRQSVLEQLGKIEKLVGVGAVLTFTDSHQGLKPDAVVVTQIKDGKFLPIQY